MKKLAGLLLVLCLIIGAVGADDGRLIIDLRAKGSAMDLNVNLTGAVNQSVKVLPHGWIDITLPEGDYTGDLLDGNGGQPEQQTARVNAGHTSYMSFLGHAVARKIRYPQTCTCGCEMVYHPERNHTVHHEAETRIITVVDEPAYCEYLQLRGHSEYRINSGPWKPGTCPIVSAFLISCVVPVCEERWIPGEIIETCHPAVTHEETITDSEAWDELVIDSPAWEEKVCKGQGNAVSAARCEG